MRKEEEIRKKLQEVIAANAKRRLPSPERIDIMNGLSFLLQKGKYETLRDWELRKAEVNKIAATFDKEDYRYRYCRRGLRASGYMMRNLSPTGGFWHPMCGHCR